MDELADHYAASSYRSDTDYVFAHPQRGSRLDIDWFRGHLDRSLAIAGVKEHVRVHDLRHAALTNLAATGASPIAVMSTAGHRSMSTTMQYVHLAGFVFRDDADALAQRMLGVQGPGTNTPQPVQVSQER